MSGRGRAIAGAASALALALVVWWALGQEEASAPGEGARSVADAVTSVDDPVIVADSDPSPFAVDPLARPAASTDDAVEDGRNSSVEASAAARVASDDVVPLAGPVDVTSLGRAPLSDEDFEALVARLAVDPDLARALADEFRSESDPERLTLLARLLGELGGPAASDLAAELVFSGDAGSREIGLELLRQVQPDSAEARDVVSSLLATESEGDALLSTLAVLSKSADVDARTRATLTTQVALLTAHEDARVRRRSLGVLSRWSEDSAHVPVLLEGLADPDAKVRQTAAYAFVGRDDPDGTIAPELITVAANDDETERTRRGAILALKSMTLDDGDRQQVMDLERALDRRPR